MSRARDDVLIRLARMLYRALERGVGLVTLAGALLLVGAAALVLLQLANAHSAAQVAGAVALVSGFGALGYLGMLTGWYLIAGRKGTDVELFPRWALFLTGVVACLFATRHAASGAPGPSSYEEIGAEYFAASRAKIGRRRQEGPHESA